MIARTAIDAFSAEIHGARGETPDERVRLALKARQEFELRKRRASVMSFDDLVGRLRDALRGGGGEAARTLLRARFGVVLVDEFQDTDPAQWQILRDAFGADPAQTTALVLIADPKQAIYAFRGADVYAYLDAIATADDQATLPVNWRSDQGLIDAHDALFAGAQLGHQEIVYRRVRAAPGHEATRLTGAPHPAPLRLRVAMREDLELTPPAMRRRATPSGSSPRTSRATSRGCWAPMRASPAPRSPPPISPCSCAPTGRPSSCGTRSTAPACPRSWPAPAACSTPRPRSSGWR